MNKLMNGVQTINSREVAEMMEVRHDHLMRKIEGINKDFNDHKIGVVKYWIESSYKDKKGELRKCYEVTKLGCEFLAHKTTGTKGNLFTAKYMDKFEEMKAQLESPSYMIDDPIARAKAWIKEQEEKQLLMGKNEQLIEENTDLHNKLDFMIKDITTITDFNRVANVLVSLIDKKMNNTSNRQAVWENLYKFMRNRHGIDLATRQQNRQVKLDNEHYNETGRHYSASTLRTKVSKKSTIKEKEYPLFLDVLKAKALDLGITLEELENALSL